MTSSSTINIILAVFNGERFLNEQLSSIFQQTFTDFHLIIRDNHSTDSTPQILKQWSDRYPENITVIYGKENLGVIGNFAHLLEKTTAPFVMFSDSDDVWLPQKVEKTLEVMRSAEQAHSKSTPILVHTDLSVVDADLHSIHPSFWEYTHLNGNKPITLNRALTENTITGCTMMLNRPLINMASPIPLEAPMHDAWIGLIVSAFGTIVSLPESTMLYRQHGKNDSGASKYGMIPKIKKIFARNERQKIVTRREKRYWQAHELLRRYENTLTEKQIAIVNTFLNTRSESLIKRFSLLKKYDLFESGCLRKLFQLFS